MIRTLVPLTFVIAVVACRAPRIEIPAEEVGRTWHPAPNGRWAVQVVPDDDRSVQQIVFRHLSHEGRDGVIDELHNPGSLLWAPNGQWLVVNHRDYATFYDFQIFELRGGSPVPRPEWVHRAQALWERAHPEPMSRLAFQGVRFERRSRSLLVIATGEPEDDPGTVIREGILLDLGDGVVQLVEDPAQLLSDWEQR